MMERNMSEMNGHEHRVSDPMEMLRGYAVQVLRTSVMGITASLPAVPPHEILLMAAQAMGEIVSQGTSVGDLPTALRLRAQAKLRFDGGVARHKISTPTQSPASMPIPQI
jgi:hypothetical protein